MTPSKSKSSPSEASNGKTTSVTPKVAKVTRNGTTKSDSGSLFPAQKPASPAPKPSSPVPKSSSPVPKPRSLVERSPKSAESKPPIKSNATPEKQQRTPKGSDLQAKLDGLGVDLKKTREQLASMEQEKIQVVEELKEAKRLTDEANGKLQEAIVAKKRAEESSEIEKFRAVELEQASIEAAQTRQEHLKELESIRNQHALDSSALLSVTEELQKVKLELANATNAKKIALREADDAKRIAETNGEKVEVLSREVSHLKSLLDSKLDDMNKEAAEMIKKLNVEINALRLELERAKLAEERLPKMEALVEQLQMEVADAKKTKFDTFKQVDELQKELASYKNKLKEANQSEKFAIESLAITMKKMEEGTALLQDAETEIYVLKGKIESMEIEVGDYKNDLKESDKKFDLSQQEAVSLEKTVDLLKAELKKLEEEKLQVLSNNKGSASDIERLLEEKNKLIDELNTSKDEGEKVRKAMEGLASALHEMSTEARENQERLLVKQSEIEEAHLQIEQLNSELKNIEERYVVMLDEARYETVCLKKTVERFETETNNSSTEWETKEVNFINAIKKSEDEIDSLKVEMGKVIDLLKVAEREAQAAKEEGAEMLSRLRQDESAAAAARKLAEEAKADALRLKEILLDKENELQSITQENDDLRIREKVALQKIEELTTMLEEATSKRAEESIKSLKSENEYGLVPNTTQETNTHEKTVDIPKAEVPSWKYDNDPNDEWKSKEENEKENKNGEDEEDPTNAMLKDLASEKDQDEESDEDFDSKMDGLAYEQISGMESMDNGAMSPSKNQQQKKKKSLYKFGNLFKKKGSHKIDK
ncbi:hypothetical protein Cni_G21998 [Canna indica]|uniref:WEB family protein n=1 Tax=Canna indica TaxID=4628 RepID=A0AAQ3QJ78_9LILI|nr:hypothetical protein Cni_G21998 [Canna indica]